MHNIKHARNLLTARCQVGTQHHSVVHEMNLFMTIFSVILVFAFSNENQRHIAKRKLNTYRYTHSVNYLQVLKVYFTREGT